MDAAAVVARLRELDARSGGRRVAWTDPWAQERERLREWIVANVPGVAVETDAAGNVWARVAGASEDEVVFGSHLDCVPDGGWLDGCLGLLAGAEALASLARAGTPARSLALVDWADEEGARFGHSLLGSSAACGLLDAAAAARLVDGDGIALPDALAAHGVTLARMGEARGQLDRAVAFVELHIEQGPVLDEAGVASAAVRGCLGVRRSGLVFRGRAGHAGATPMRLRRDPVLACARFAQAVRDLAAGAGGLATIGVLRSDPPTPTAIPAAVHLTLDLRHADLATLTELDAGVTELAERAAGEEGCSAEREPLWAIDPILFDDGLVERAAALAAAPEPLTSGPLHDAAAVARAGIPAVMLFVRTAGGISHSREENARDEDLVAGIEAFGTLVRDLTERQ